VWLAVPRNFELVPLGQVLVFSRSWTIYLHWMIRSGKNNATIWQIEELPCSCFGFRYRSGPTDSDLFSIAWPSCYRIQEHCTNGNFFSIGVFNSTRTTFAWEDNFAKVNPAKRGKKHCVFNWDTVCSMTSTSTTPILQSLKRSVNSLWSSQ
jgi:hypothetical protein